MMIATTIARSPGTNAATLTGECGTDAFLMWRLIETRVVALKSGADLCDTGSHGDRESERRAGECESKPFHENLLAVSNCRYSVPRLASTSRVEALNIGCQAIYATGNARSRMKIDQEIRTPNRMDHKASRWAGDRPARQTKALKWFSMNPC